ncbi:elongator complex protein 4-like [Limulus polyphemus]|uniref:Elongator complex protein 4 n=1 Tax=Limulus polyphemus TaxID=6850 RepID=A0ABM1BPM2_LIMPO|nr:elongator complex protein 4-like [Limulus polyphemus]
MAVSSFQKKTKHGIPKISGTRPSLRNSQLLISTGVPSLDYFIGGGLAVGTVMLIEEDVFGAYARILLKYFISEGIVCGHSLFLSGGDVSPTQILQGLPAPISDNSAHRKSEPESRQVGAEPMKIAWRYTDLPVVQPAPAVHQFGHYYDVSLVMDSKLMQQCDIETYDICEGSTESPQQFSGTLLPQPYQMVLYKIWRRLKKGNFLTSSNPAQPNILRIGIHSLGSPLWRTISDSERSSSSDSPMFKFLHLLRALLRSAYAVCVVTVPLHLIQDVERLRFESDTVVKLESFAGSDKEMNPVFKDYHGLFHIVKLPRLNSLTSFIPETKDLCFQLKKKKFAIEKLHIPPDLSETASRTNKDPVVDKISHKLIGCSSATKIEIDF